MNSTLLYSTTHLDVFFIYILYNNNIIYIYIAYIYINIFNIFNFLYDLGCGDCRTGEEGWMGWDDMIWKERGKLRRERFGKSSEHICPVEIGSDAASLLAAAAAKKEGRKEEKEKENE